MKRPVAALIAACSFALVACASSDTGDGATSPLAAQPSASDTVGGANPTPVSEVPASEVAVSEVAVSEVPASDVAVSRVAESVPPATSEPLIEVVQPEGFTTVTVEITEADGDVCEVCMWLADSPEERARGLMGVTDLGEPEGMAFLYGQPTEGQFYMFRTVTPLSIAWFAAPPSSGAGSSAGGELVSMTDMEPCPFEEPGQCERFPAGGEFVLAVEVFRGDLASIGITEGATARVVPGTEAPECIL